MKPLPTSSKRSWNGYGLSIWACKCGARRRVTGYVVVAGEYIESAIADPCRRCGSTENPTTCHGDPWGGEDG